jgi:hypothetical protein
MPFVKETGLRNYSHLAIRKTKHGKENVYEAGVSWEVGLSVSAEDEATVVAEATGFSVAEGSGLGFEAGFSAGSAAGFGGGLGFSGLIPPSQWGPVYISSASPAAFHLFSKSAAARLGVSPIPTRRFQG